MDRAKKFYQSLFNFDLTPMPGGPDLEMYGFPGDMNAPGASGALAKMKGFEPASNSTIIYFRSEDCSEEKRVVSLGGRIQKPKMSIGEYGFISLLIDSEGNMIGLHSMK